MTVGDFKESSKHLESFSVCPLKSNWLMQRFTLKSKNVGIRLPFTCIAFYLYRFQCFVEIGIYGKLVDLPCVGRRSVNLLVMYNLKPRHCGVSQIGMEWVSDSHLMCFTSFRRDFPPEVPVRTAVRVAPAFENLFSTGV